MSVHSGNEKKSIDERKGKSMSRKLWMLRCFLYLKLAKGCRSNQHFDKFRCDSRMEQRRWLLMNAEPFTQKHFLLISTHGQQSSRSTFCFSVFLSALEPVSGETRLTGSSPAGSGSDLFGTNQHCSQKTTQVPFFYTWFLLLDCTNTTIFSQNRPINISYPGLYFYI